MKEWWSVFPKVGVDQLIWGPFWNGTYVFTTATLEGSELQKSI